MASPANEPGRELPAADRLLYEARLGVSLDKVRLHTGEASGRSANRLRLKAFTTGADVHLGPADRDPSTARGGHTLAHELAHVVQQSTATGPELAYAEAEEHADRTALALLSGGPVPHPGRTAPGSVQGSPLSQAEIDALDLEGLKHRLAENETESQAIVLSEDAQDDLAKENLALKAALHKYGPEPPPAATPGKGGGTTDSAAGPHSQISGGGAASAVSISGLEILTFSGGDAQTEEAYDGAAHEYRLLVRLPAGSTFTWNEANLALLGQRNPGIRGAIAVLAPGLGENPIVIPRVRTFGAAKRRPAAQPPQPQSVAPPPQPQSTVPAPVDPMPVQPGDPGSVANMDTVDRLKESILAAGRHLPGELGEQLKQLLSPEALALMAAFAAAQALGVGEIADVVGLLLLALKIGDDAPVVAEDLFEFFRLTLGARSQQDLDEAGAHLAHAIGLAGVDTLLALLAAKGESEGRGKGAGEGEGEGPGGKLREQEEPGSREQPKEQTDPEEGNPDRESTSEGVDEVNDGVSTDEDVHPDDQAEPQASEPELDPAICFPAGTLVATPTGARAIEMIRTGDQVWSYDWQLGEAVVATVGGTVSGRTTRWIDVDLGRIVVRSTAGHRFWLESKQDWCRAADLPAGAQVRTRDGQQLEVIGTLPVEPTDGTAATYNLSVEGTECYFVGSAGVLVHNITKSRFRWLSRPGFRNYELVDASGKVYYSGLFGPKVPESAVRARHAANHDRFDPRPVSEGGRGDRLRLRAGTREYGEARQLEMELAVESDTIDVSKPNTYRCNRQDPLAPKKATEIEEYEEVKAGCG